MSSSSSPLLFIQSNAGICVPSSPTSTVEIHELNSSFEAKSMSVDCLSSVISEISCCSSSQPSTVKKSKVAIRTIHNSDIKITKPFHMVLDLKLQLCCDTPLNIADLMIIRDGKELSNCDPLNSEDLKTSKVFVMVNSKSKTIIPITLKTQGVEGAKTKTLKVNLSMKVNTLKKDLFSGKMTTLKPESQRIIVGGKVLQDCFIIGDYLLYAILNKPVTLNASSSSSPAKYHSTPSGKVITPLCTVYLSKTTNLKHEVNVTFVSGTKNIKYTRELKYGVEIAKPISLFNTILHREFRLPPPTETVPYVFYLRIPTAKPSDTITTKNITTKKAAPKSPPAYTLIELDPTKTLLDYGLDTSSKCVTVEVVQRDLNNPLSYTWDPIVFFLFMNKMMSVYAHAARLKCEATGGDLTGAAPAVAIETLPQNTVSAAVSGKTSLSLMQATNAKNTGSMFDSDTEEDGGRSPNSVVNSKKRPTSPRETERSVSPKRTASAVATHVTTTSEKTVSVTPPKKASSGGGGGGLFGNLKLKKGFLSKK